MPGILGVSGKHSGADGTFTEMVKVLNHFNYQTDIFHGPALSVGRVHRNETGDGQQPVFSPDRRLCLVMTGEIFSYNERMISDRMDDAVFLLERYIDSGVDCLPGMNGQFTAAICDTANRKVILISDRFGTRPLYYRADSGDLLFASELKALINKGEKRKLNPDAVSELFHFEFLFGDHTIFEDIRMLPPASYLEFQDGKITITRYWNFPYEVSAYHKADLNRRRISALTEELQVRFGTAVRRQARRKEDKLLLPLSGGLDSRWVAAELQTQGIESVQTFTLGEPSTYDVLYAAMVARELGFPHDIFTIQPADVWENARRFSYLSDGMYKISGPVQMTVPLQTYTGREEVVLMPQMCDMLFGSSLYRPKVAALIGKKKMDTESRNNLLQMFNRIPEDDLRTVFEADFYGQIKERHQSTILAYIRQSPDPLHCYFCLVMEQYGRRGTFGGNQLVNLYYETRMPSYDNELFEFGFRLPVSLRKGQWLYRKAFSEKFPALARIPRDKNNLPIDISAARNYLKQVEKVLIRRLKRTPLKALIDKVDKWNRPNYVDYEKWFRGDLQSQLRGLLTDKRTLERGIMDPKGLEKLLDEHIRLNRDHSAVFWQLVNLEYIQRNFID